VGRDHTLFATSAGRVVFDWGVGGKRRVNIELAAAE
jgi:ribosomal protein L27